MLSVLILGTAGAHDRSAPPSSLSRSRVLQHQQQSTRGDALATVQCLRGGGGDKCDVILVGCGVPKRGMGWYHAKQMLDGDVPSATLTTVVEPWFLGQGKDSPPGQTFGVWAEEMSKAHGTKFCASLDEVSINGPTMALISGRTADNPRLLKEVIDLGCTAVYLEKPGAPTVKELEEMRAYAKSKGVQVFMGYNKNVTPYVRKALEFARKPNRGPGAALDNRPHLVHDLVCQGGPFPSS